MFFLNSGFEFNISKKCGENLLLKYTAKDKNVISQINLNDNISCYKKQFGENLPPHPIKKYYMFDNNNELDYENITDIKLKNLYAILVKRGIINFFDTLHDFGERI